MPTDCHKAKKVDEQIMRNFLLPDVTECAVEELGEEEEELCDPGLKESSLCG